MTFYPASYNPPVMSRIVRTESGATRRRRLLQGMAQALREVSRSPAPSATESRQILAFLSLALAQLQASVEDTAGAWERRSYWVKADRFRRDWGWVSHVRSALDAALQEADLERAAACGMELATAIAAIRVRPGRSIAGLWDGAWEAWLAERHSS